MAIGSQKSRTHRVIVTITMNRKCSRAVALREAKDNIHGQHYCTPYYDRDPDEFRIRSVRLAPKKAVRS